MATACFGAIWNTTITSPDSFELLDKTRHSVRHTTAQLRQVGQLGALALALPSSSSSVVMHCGFKVSIITIIVVVAECKVRLIRTVATAAISNRGGSAAVTAAAATFPLAFFLF
jgi:hypothetical protein